MPELKNSEQNSTGIVQRDKNGRLLPGSQLPKTPRPETLALRQLKNDVLTQIAPQVIPTWIKLMGSQSEKIRLGAVKLAVETVFPKQIIHNMVGKILHEHEGHEGEKMHGLLTALPEFGKFLRWKAEQDSQGKIVDVEPIQGDQTGNTISDDDKK